MAIHLDTLRPATARRVAYLMCALFLMLGAWGLAYGVLVWLRPADALSEGWPWLKITNSVLSVIVAAVVIFVGLRFGRYAAKLRVRHTAGT